MDIYELLPYIIIVIILLIIIYNSKSSKKSKSKNISYESNEIMEINQNMNKNIKIIVKFIKTILLLYKQTIRKESENIVDRINKKSLFNKDIQVKHLLLDSYSSNNHIIGDSNQSNKIQPYIYRFHNKSDPHGNIPKFKNVISIRLTNLIIPSQPYTIHNNNNKIIYDVYSGDTISKVQFTIEPGFYTDDILPEVFNDINNYEMSDGSIFDNEDNMLSIIPNNITNRYIIQSKNIDNQIKIYWSKSNYSYHFFGFSTNDSEKSTILTSLVHPTHTYTYIDLVIKEIPEIATKENINGLKVFDRISLSSDINQLNIHKTTLNEQVIYFYPIDIHTLTIELYDPYGNLINFQNAEFSIEFEIQYINNISSVGLI
ncbi:MAG: hypothetical protein CMG46_01840 [Candidatus Marinimicrobia bacterium]|nr:hypothetical protein [Candidatus Neomarinimicrobiota bacterium]